MGNGRTVKSRFATPNRVDVVKEPINAIFWIMKDDSLPPLMKINDPIMAATMGCNLMTKRSSAENIKSGKQTLVIDPFANPFRVYSLVEDYQKFCSLFSGGVDCYIINTGSYLSEDISKETSIASIEEIVDSRAVFKLFGQIENFEYLELENFPIHPFDNQYKQIIRSWMHIRLNFLLSFYQNYPKFALPVEGISRLEKVINQLK